MKASAKETVCTWLTYGMGVVIGGAGALYFGANVEFVKGTMALTIHAEQAAIINVHAHGETGVKRLAITAEPCGYCRQFLKELTTAGELIILTGARSLTLAELLPNAFGPGDLGVQERLLAPQDHSAEMAGNPGELTTAAHFRLPGGQVPRTMSD